MSELGAVWNGYSLLEKGKLGEAVEKVGQAVDGEYLATAALVCHNSDAGWGARGLFEI